MTVERESPFIFLRYAKEFLESGDTVRNHKNPNGIPTGQQEQLEHPFIPIFLLYGHSIELSLKAYLRYRGESVTELRSKRLAHNLAVLLAECESQRISSVLAVTDVHREVVRLLNQRYSTKRLEYGQVGAYSLPLTADVARLATLLVRELLGVIKPYPHKS